MLLKIWKRNKNAQQLIHIRKLMTMPHLEASPKRSKGSTSPHLSPHSAANSTTQSNISANGTHHRSRDAEDYENTIILSAKDRLMHYCAGTMTAELVARSLTWLHTSMLQRKPIHPCTPAIMISCRLKASHLLLGAGE